MTTKHSDGTGFSDGSGCRSTADPTPVDLDREIGFLATWQAALNGAKGSNSAGDWADFEAAEAKALERIEALPATPENLRLKARAIRLLYPDGLSEFLDESTDCRLARQIVAGLTDGHDSRNADRWQELRQQTAGYADDMGAVIDQAISAGIDYDDLRGIQYGVGAGDGYPTALHIGPRGGEPHTTVTAAGVHRHR